jgi:hypothetical protein
VLPFEHSHSLDRSACLGRQPDRSTNLNMEPPRYFTPSTPQNTNGQRRALAINEMLNHGSPPSHPVPFDGPYPGLPPHPPGRPQSPLISDWSPRHLGDMPRPYDLHHWRNHYPAPRGPPIGMNPHRGNHDYYMTHAQRIGPGHNGSPLPPNPCKPFL